MSRPFLLLGLLVLFACSTNAFAQEHAPPLDGPHRIFQDGVLDQMVGNWNLRGTVRGQVAEHAVQADWVLNHQFLRIHEKAAAPPKEGPAYEAIVMIGYDNASERYVAHWTDIYGGRASETLGYGRRSGDAIEFIFEYSDGPFHTTFRWEPEKKSWQWLMRTRNTAGQWADFGTFTLARRDDH